MARFLFHSPLFWYLVTTIELFCVRRSFVERSWEYVCSYQPIESALVLESHSTTTFLI